MKAKRNACSHVYRHREINSISNVARVPVISFVAALFLSHRAENTFLLTVISYNGSKIIKTRRKPRRKIAIKIRVCERATFLSRLQERAVFVLELYKLLKSEIFQLNISANGNFTNSEQKKPASRFNIYIHFFLLLDVEIRFARAAREIITQYSSRFYRESPIARPFWMVKIRLHRV